MRRRRRTAPVFGNAQGGGLGLQSLTELAHRNRSPFARWWRNQSHLAQIGYRILFALSGGFVAVVALMALGVVLMP